MSDLTFVELHSAKNGAAKRKSRLDRLKKLTHLYFHDKYIQNIVRLKFNICI